MEFKSQIEKDCIGTLAIYASREKEILSYAVEVGREILKKAKSIRRKQAENIAQSSKLASDIAEARKAQY